MSASSPGTRPSQPRPCCAEPRRGEISPLARDGPRLDRKTFVRRRVEELFRRHQTRRKSLRMVVTQESLKLLAIRPEPIRPEVMPHELAGRAQLLFHEGQSPLARGSFIESGGEWRHVLLVGVEHR